MASDDRTESSDPVKGAPERRPGTRLLRLFAYTRPYALRLTLALSALLIASGLGLVYPSYFGKAIDAAFTTKDVSSLNSTALLLVAVFAIQAVFIFTRHYLMSWVGERVVADIRGQLYRHLVTMPQSYYHRTRTGELLSRLGDDVTRLQTVVGEDLSMGLRNLITLVGGVTILLVINLRLTLVMLAVVPAIVLLSALWGRLIRRLSKEAQQRLAEATAILQEGLAGIETVQAFTRESYETKRYEGGIAATFSLYLRMIQARSWFMAVASFLAFVTLAGIFWLGGHMVVAGTISAGELTTFFIYTMAVAAAVGAMAGLYGSYQQALGATERIFEILDEAPAIADPVDPVVAPVFRGALRLRNVSFSYADRSVPVIADLDLDIAPGEVVALVGASGSGKTTVARLVMRFWDPTDGRIELDGHPLQRYRVADLRAAMAIVSQEPLLFSGSIRENIRYGRLEATDAEVEDAARAANADGFISAFPAGYDTIVGERGVKLSGGQRQRVSIARAILRDPRVLILDEATSALDGESEALVQDALERLQAGRTTLIIAHRLSTIAHADRILVLDAGRVIEQGRHDELMRLGGAYARLVARQARASAEATEHRGSAVDSGPAPVNTGGVASLSPMAIEPGATGT